MTKTQLAGIWAAVILAVALAASAGLVGEQIARFTYLALVAIAVLSLRRAPCEGR